PSRSACTSSLAAPCPGRRAGPLRCSPTKSPKTVSSAWAGSLLDLGPLVRYLSNMDPDLYDKIADAELHGLERALGQLDPDELEVDLSQGVLTLEFSDGNKVVVNSHRAAGEI